MDARPAAARSHSGQLGTRTDSTFRPNLPAILQTYSPTLAENRLSLPYTNVLSIELEHRMHLPTLEFQAAFRRRTGYDLPTIEVPAGGGAAALDSAGTSNYKELAMSVRQATWRADRELFVSYVHSSSLGNVNDYGTLVSNLDAPLFEPAGIGPMATDSPDRLRSWATNLQKFRAKW